MTEEKEEEYAPFDAEWEWHKMRARFTDIMGMIEELKATDRTLSARISRLKLKSIQAESEGEDEVLEEPAREDVREQIESMTLEERAVLYARLVDRE